MPLEVRNAQKTSVAPLTHTHVEPPHPWTPTEPAEQPAATTEPLPPSEPDPEPRTGTFPLITAPAPLSTEGHLRGRLDVLDGVRAVAVAMVVAFHVGVPGVFAGFLGVDLFFVLSGFLISTLLLRQMHRHGRVRLTQFWARRVLRLLPASLLMMGAVAAYAFTVGPPDARAALLADLQWCLVYLGNWHFIGQSSYFLNDGTVSPLQHVWSLAVEEQFYVVWPLGIVLVAWGLRRSRHRTGTSPLYRAWGRLVAGLMPLVTLHERLTGTTPDAPTTTSQDSKTRLAPSVAAPESSPDPPRSFPATFSAARIARLTGTHPRAWQPLPDVDTSDPTRTGLRRFLPAPPERHERGITFAGPLVGRIPTIEDLATRSPAWFRLLTRCARAVRDATRAPDMTPATIELLLLLGVFTVLMGAVSAVVMALLFDPQHPERAYMGTDAKLFEPLMGGVAAAAMIWPGVREAIRRRAAWLLWPALACLGVCLFTLGGSDGASSTYFTGGAFAFSLAAAILIAVLVSGAPRDVFDDQPGLSYMAHLDAATAVIPRPGVGHMSASRRVGYVLHTAERRLRKGIAALLASAPIAYVGRLSYGIYLWHWPLAVYAIPDRTAPDPWRALAVVGASLLAAALSHHLIEKPILSGRFAIVRPRLVLACWATVAVVATAAVMFLATHLTGPASQEPPVVASPQQGSTATPPTSVLFIGDSVPSRLGRFLDNAAKPYGIDVDVAAVGGCGGMPVNSSVFLETDCTKRVPEIQNKYLNAKKYSAVVWWSRWEMAPRNDSDLGEITQETQRFWHRQKTDLQRHVDRLARSANTIVIVEPERVGRRVERVVSKNPKALPNLMRDNPYQVREKWIAVLRAQAKADPRVKLISVDALVCRDTANPCDDRLPLRESTATAFAAAPEGGPFARTDGTHFDTPAGQPVIARILITLVRGVVPALHAATPQPNSLVPTSPGAVVPAPGVPAPGVPAPATTSAPVPVKRPTSAKPSARPGNTPSGTNPTGPTNAIPPRPTTTSASPSRVPHVPIETPTVTRIPTTWSPGRTPLPPPTVTGSPLLFLN